MLIPGSSLLNNYRLGDEECCLTIQGITLSLHCHIVMIKTGCGLPKSLLLFRREVLVSHGGVIEDLSPAMLCLVDSWTLKWKHYVPLKYRQFPVDME